ncbi:MAG TPA: MaoC family dehydratase [Alphaproteobacteria bacterium]|nr:MaoC family dehydratase [Alphaproteobacteria bacterium]
MSGRYFEDFTVGEEMTTGGVTLTEDAIIDFAYRYDPQPFHVDKEAAAASHFGGLIASSWHTQIVAFRQVIDSGFLGNASMGSPGCDELRFLKPVRPGDTVRTRLCVLDKRTSRTRDDRGYVTVEFDIQNQNGDTVITWRGIQIIGRRPKDV